MPGSSLLNICVGAITLLGAIISSAAQANQPPKAGINLSGGEFNPAGTRKGVDYEYPGTADIRAARQAGFRLVRLPFLAKRLLGVPERRSPDEKSDIEEVTDLVDAAAEAGVVVVLDMHDYGFTADGELIGATADSTRSFASSWFAIAAMFRDRPNVIFGLMNEPHYQTAALWRDAANLAIAMIRSAGARQGVLVPTTDWSVASRWSRNGTPQEMLKIIDPENNFAFELHQYVDHDESGKHDTVRPGIGATSLIDFTNWARMNGRRAVLGEFAWTNNAAAEREGEALLAFMSANADVWAGWTYWGGGRKWGKYMFALDAGGGRGDARMRMLQKYMGSVVASGAAR